MTTLPPANVLFCNFDFFSDLFFFCFVTGEAAAAVQYIERALHCTLSGVEGGDLEEHNIDHSTKKGGSRDHNQNNHNNRKRSTTATGTAATAVAAAQGYAMGRVSERPDGLFLEEHGAGLTNKLLNDPTVEAAAARAGPAASEVASSSSASTSNGGGASGASGAAATSSSPGDAAPTAAAAAAAAAAGATAAALAEVGSSSSSSSPNPDAVANFHNSLGECLRAAGRPHDALVHFKV